MTRMNRGKTPLLWNAASARTLRQKTAIMDCAGVAAVAARATADGDLSQPFENGDEMHGQSTQN